MLFVKWQEFCLGIKGLIFADLLAVGPSYEYPNTVVSAQSIEARC